MAQDMTGSAAAAVAAVKERTAAAPVEGVPSESPPAVTPPPQDDPFAKREKQLRRQQMEIEQREKALKVKEQQYSEDWMPKKDLEKYVPRDRFQEDPLGVLAEMGYDGDKLSQLLISGHNSQDPTIKALRAELRQIKEAQDQFKKQQESQTTQNYDQAIQQISREVEGLVDSSPDFEMIKTSGMADAVVELIKETWEKSSTLLDIEDAARQVEEHLVEEAYKLAQLSKVQSRFKPAAPDSAKAPTQQQQGLKTLTNSVTQDQPTNTRLTDKQRRERAVAAFMGKLNQ